MFKSRKAGQEESWEGVVVGKSRGMLDGSNLYHHVEVRLPEGVRKLRISRDLWKSVAEGDRLVKRPGADPVKE
ncbi:hypothetical protein [Streptomyces sp. NPDC005573]|uniref:DUF7489 domain-containing protein n=1 Tax=unclassified Streptomyces TaxID=2593676 RepID=UPI0033B661D9